jgi:rhodanese-related sulfurtransferase
MPTMPSAITVSELAKVAGTASAPLLIDVRREQGFKAANDMIAGAIRRSPDNVERWRGDLSERGPVVVYCAHGQEVSQGVAAALAGRGVGASYLSGGIAAWAEQKLPVRRKREEEQSPSKWVTRERPKIDRIACPWLIRRFIDPAASFIYVPADRVLAIAEETGATPSDDHEMLEHGMVMYDALYTWCRSLQAETHNWPAASMQGARRG